MNYNHQSKRGKNDRSKYSTLFLKEPYAPPARFGKSVYIRKEYHEQISQIVSVIGGNDVTLSGYLDNVLTNHFKEFWDEIACSFNKKIIFK